MGWALFRDTIAEDGRGYVRTGAFLTTLVAFFLAEIGDKMQISAVALAARLSSFMRSSSATTRMRTPTMTRIVARTGRSTFPGTRALRWLPKKRWAARETCTATRLARSHVPSGTPDIRPLR